jgi:hypothetical protein
MHARADAHDTLLTPGDSTPRGRGKRRIDHREPFHRAPTNPAPAVPMTMHTLRELHDTASKETGPPLRSFGAAWADQRAPFQRSTSGPTVHGPYEPQAPVSKSPIAMQALAEAHDTLFRSKTELIPGFRNC